MTAARSSALVSALDADDAEFVAQRIQQRSVMQRTRDITPQRFAHLRGAG